MILVASALTLTMLLASGSVAAVNADPLAEDAGLIGTRAPGWETAEWLNGESLRLEDLRGKVVLVRWWTDTCHYCTRSAPALNELHERYADGGLTVVGMYHPKPIDRAITASEIREAAQQRGFHFPIAIDRDWAMLRRWWLGDGRRRATSVSFLIDKRGLIRYIHPGPAYHRQVVAGDERPSRDFAKLQQMIEELLAEPST